MAQGSIELKPEPWAAQSLKDGLQKLSLLWLSFDGLQLPGWAEHNTTPDLFLHVQQELWLTISQRDRCLN